MTKRKGPSKADINTACRKLKAEMESPQMKALIKDWNEEVRPAALVAAVPDQSVAYIKVSNLEELRTAKPQFINPRRCPHYIMVGEHYRADGSCRCDDPTAKVMLEWGYVWRDNGWSAPEEE